MLGSLQWNLGGFHQLKAENGGGSTPGRLGGEIEQTERTRLVLIAVMVTALRLMSQRMKELNPKERETYENTESSHVAAVVTMAENVFLP